MSTSETNLRPCRGIAQFLYTQMLKFACLTLLVSISAHAGASSNCQANFAAPTHSHLSSSPSTAALYNILASYHPLKTAYLTRGFAHAEYNLANFLKLLANDRSQEFRSKTYQKYLAEARALGQSEAQAIITADLKTATFIYEQIAQYGPKTYAEAEQTRSFITTDRQNKTSASLFFTPQEMEWMAFNYSHFTKNLIREKSPEISDNSIRLFVLQIKSEDALAIPTQEVTLDNGTSLISEYSVQSHIEAKQIRGAFVGYTAPGKTIQWYYVMPYLENNLPSVKIHFAFHDGKNKSPKVGDLLFKTSLDPKKVNRESLRQFTGTHPEHETLVREILEFADSSMSSTQ